jgi:hypothetical protein
MGTLAFSNQFYRTPCYMHIIAFALVFFRQFINLIQVYLVIVSGEAEDEISSVESLQFDFGTIKVATKNFSNANKLGQGGFGAVYKVN